MWLLNKIKNFFNQDTRLEYTLRNFREESQERCDRICLLRDKLKENKFIKQEKITLYLDNFYTVKKEINNILTYHAMCFHHYTGIIEINLPSSLVSWLEDITVVICVDEYIEYIADILKKRVRQTIK